MQKSGKSAAKIYQTGICQYPDVPNKGSFFIMKNAGCFRQH